MFPSRINLKGVDERMKVESYDTDVRYLSDIYEYGYDVIIYTNNTKIRFVLKEKHL